MPKRVSDGTSSRTSESTYNSLCAQCRREDFGNVHKLGRIKEEAVAADPDPERGDGSGVTGLVRRADIILLQHHLDNQPKRDSRIADEQHPPTANMVHKNGRDEVWRRSDDRIDGIEQQWHPVRQAQRFVDEDLEVANTEDPSALRCKEEEERKDRSLPPRCRAEEHLPVRDLLQLVVFDLENDLLVLGEGGGLVVGIVAVVVQLLEYR